MGPILGEGYITQQNLFEFYTDFMLLDDKRSRTVAENAWIQMTGVSHEFQVAMPPPPPSSPLFQNGDFKLTLELYTMSFSNFLFGKSFYGPGLFILGTFRECFERVPFKIIPPTEEDH